MKKLTKKLTIGDVLRDYSNAKDILGGFGLHCFGCPMSQMETLEEAAQVHGVDIDFMMSKLSEDLVPMTTKAPKTCCSCCKATNKTAKTTKAPVAKSTKTTKSK